MSEATDELIFYQKGESVLDIGGMSVLPGYSDQRGKLVPMIWIGDPVAGDKVRLTYRIVEGKPNFVYGVRLVLLSNRPTQAILGDSSSIPTAIPTFSPVPCEPVRPEGWVLYRTTVDDSLASLAIRTGAPLRTLLSVNCRTDTQLAAGTSIFLPAVPGVTVSDVSQ